MVTFRTPTEFFQINIYIQNLQALQDYFLKINIHQREYFEHKYKLWDMCIAGLNYFLLLNPNPTTHIHFILTHYNANINDATLLELEWLQSVWNSDHVRSHVTFYTVVHNQLIKCVAHLYIVE